MPRVHQGDAAAYIQQVDTVEMGSSASSNHFSSVENDHDRPEVAGKIRDAEKPKNKQSLDYVMKTGFLGGLAGCAVHHPESQQLYESSQC